MIIFFERKICWLLYYFYNLHRYGEVKSKKLFLMFILLHFSLNLRMSVTNYTSPSVVIAHTFKLSAKQKINPRFKCRKIIQIISFLIVIMWLTIRCIIKTSTLEILDQMPIQFLWKILLRQTISNCCYKSLDSTFTIYLEQYTIIGPL